MDFLNNLKLKTYGIKSTIIIDDDRYAKHPYGVKFYDEECNLKIYTNSVIELSKEPGTLDDIDLM